MTDEDYYIELSREAKHIFEEYISKTQQSVGLVWEIGPYSAIKPILTMLLLGTSEMSEKYYQMRKNGITIEDSLNLLINNLMPSPHSEELIIVKDKSQVVDFTLHPWYKSLMPFRERLLIYIHDSVQLETIIPLISILNRPIILLSEYDIPDNMEFPDYISALILESPTSYHLKNSFLERNFPTILNYFNTFDLLLRILCPEGILTIGARHYQEQILFQISSDSKIPATYIHTEIASNIFGNAYNNEANYINRVLKCKYLTNAKVPKLHIGSGPYAIEGWLNVDITCISNEIKYMNAAKHFPFPDQSFDAVYSEHMFEHLTIDQGINMLKESFRILRRNGIIRLAIPHLDFLLNLCKDPENNIHAKYINWSIEHFMPEIMKLYPNGRYPAMYVMNNFYRDWGHQMIYDQKGISDLLIKCGFHNLRFCKLGKSTSQNMKNLERHENSIPQWAVELETLIIEGDKE